MVALTDKFDTIHQKKKELKNGTVIYLDYISWSQVADRLDEATGHDWSFEIRQVGPDWVWGKLTIGERSYENIGYAENADADWKSEVLKDAVSDALKRCAALAGVGRYLYDKDTSPHPVTGTGRAAQPAVPPPAKAASSPARPAAVHPAINRSIEKAADDVMGGAGWKDDPYGESMVEGDFGPQTADECPVHRVPWKVGKNGGRFCSRKNADGSWCQERP